MRTLQKAQRKSTWMRILGCQQRSNDFRTSIWSLDKKAIVLEQCCIIDKDDIKMSPEVRPLGAPFTPPDKVFGEFWKTRVNLIINIPWPCVPL